MEDLVRRVMEELRKYEGSSKQLFPVEASAKHVHLSQEDVEKLFGIGHKLTFDRELSQPGQFLAKERVLLVGPKGVIEKVAVLGPARSKTQVEISLTDSRILGVKGVLRESGKIEGSSGIVISNGSQAIAIKEGVIIAHRHIHMSPENAQKLGVQDQMRVNVKIHSTRPLIFEDVIVRVDSSFNLSMHVDFDEANACALDKQTMGEILC